MRSPDVTLLVGDDGFNPLKQGGGEIQAPIGPNRARAADTRRERGGSGRGSWA